MKKGFNPVDYRYRVFISYSRTDSVIVDELYERLSHYRTPRPLIKRVGAYGVPPRSLRIFLDRKSAEAGGTLPGRLREKLHDSAFLIVVCSRNSVDRPWINQEIEIFLEKAEPARIIPILLREDRESPIAKITPRALAELGLRSPLAADFILDGGMLAVRDKVIGGLLGFAQDEIAREQEGADARARRRAWLIGVLMTLLATLAIVAALVAEYQRGLAQERLKIAEARSLVVQSKAIVEADPTRALRLLEQAHALRPSPEVSYEIARTFYSLRQQRVLLTSSEVIPSRAGKSAVSFDGSLIVSWSEEQRVARVWSRDGNLMATLEHQEPLHAVSFLPGSQLILTASAPYPAAKHRVQIWSSDGSLKSDLPIDGVLFDIVSLPDSKGFAITSFAFQQKVVLVDYNGQPYEEIPLPRFMHKLHISKDGSQLVTWNTDYNFGASAYAHLLTREGEQIARLAHGNSIGIARILDNGRVLTWGGDNFVRIWDGTGTLLLEIADLIDVAVSMSGRHVGLFWKSGRFGLLDTETLHVAKESNLGVAQGAVFAGDDSRLVVWFKDLSVKVLDFEGEVVSQFNHGPAAIIGVRVSSAGHRVLTWGDKILRVWNDRGELLGEMVHDRRIDAANLLEEGDQIISWEGLGPGGFVEDAVYKARLWRSNGELIGEMRHRAMIRGADVRTGDGSILTWADDGSVKLWRQVHYTVRVEAARRAYPVSAVFSDDDELILVWFEDGLVQLLNARGQRVREVRHSGQVAGARFVGDRVWSWTSQGEVFIWDRSEEVVRVRGPKGSYGIAFAANAERFITWSTERAVVWNGLGRAVAELSAEEMRGAALAPDGRRAVTWDANGQVFLWSDSGDKIVEFTHDVRGVREVLFSSDTQKILFHTYGPRSEEIEHPVTLRRWDGSVIADFPHADAPLRAMFVPSQQRLLTWWETRAPAKLWGLDGQLISALSHGKGVGVPNLQVSASGRNFITWVAGQYNYSPDEMKIWDNKGDPVAMLPHPTRITWVRINSRGSHILTTTHANWIRIWDIAGNLVGEVNHGHDVAGAEFLDRSEYLLIWGGGTVKLLTYRGVPVMEAENMPSRVLAVSNDEATLLTTSWSGLELIPTPKGIWRWLATTSFYQLSTDEMRTFDISGPID